jgi:hypothetical protein
VGIDLVTVTKSLFKAQELKITGDPDDAFMDATDKGPGLYSLCAKVKTSELFDPYDDLFLSSEKKALEAANPDAQLFFYGPAIEVEHKTSSGKVQKSKSTDGYIFAMNFNCKDEAQAKKVYSHLFTEDMKKTAMSDSDKPAYDFGTDHAIATVAENRLVMTMCYYRLGNNVLAAGMYKVTGFGTGKPINYTKKADYSADLDKLCKAFGAKKLPSSVKK